MFFFYLTEGKKAKNEGAAEDETGGKRGVEIWGEEKKEYYDKV